MLVGGHGEVNPNANWLQSRGLWIAYGLGVLAFHIFLLSIPFLTVPVAWTITNLSHNALHLIFLHTLKGTPWPSQDQGDCRRLTHWEQIDDGLQFTSTRKFLSVTPVILFFLTNLYTKYDPIHFYINFLSLIVVLLPKLPQFHKVILCIVGLIVITITRTTINQSIYNTSLSQRYLTDKNIITVLLLASIYNFVVVFGCMPKSLKHSMGYVFEVSLFPNQIFS